jgi:hypothetical protein
MNTVERFAHYAMAFEQALVSDDWSAVAECLSPDAVYETFGDAPLAGRAEGREEVVDRLRRGVAGLDRRFDLRVPSLLEGPREREGGVWMRFALSLSRAGLPDLTLTGDHTTYFHGDRIWRIEEYVPVIVCRAVKAYLTAHEGALQPTAIAPQLVREVHSTRGDVTVNEGLAADM